MKTNCGGFTEKFILGAKDAAKNLKSWKIWRLIYLAQILSLIICGTGVTNSKLSDVYNINIPTTQSIVNYFLLAVIYTPIWFCYVDNKRDILVLMKKNWWKYLLITLADVEANYLVIKAYSLTLLTTIQVIDAFILPMVMIFSRLILKTVYKGNHIAGVIGCLLGCASIIAADTIVKQASDGTHRLTGDLLCLASSVLYAISNVGQEYLVKQYSKLEYLSTTGLFGIVISTIQFLILERTEFTSINFSQLEIVFLLLATNLLLFMLYSLFPHVVEMSGAAFININLLTADFYAVLIGLFAYKYQLHFLYFFGFIFILVGTILFCINDPLNNNQTKKVSDIDKQLEAIEEEDLSNKSSKEEGVVMV